MTGPTDERLLAFLEGTMDEPERTELLEALDRDPALAESMRAAAAGLEAMRTLEEPARVPAGADDPMPARRVPTWWIAAAAAITLLLAVPTTLLMQSVLSGGPSTDSTALAGRPEAPNPTFVLVLHGRWPDAGTLDPSVVQQRGREYWNWTSSLAAGGVLVAAGDLRWEPGERLGPGGGQIQVRADELDRSDYVVGMFALRVDSYEEALAVARECPHLRYGGSVSVRRVAAGFVTVPGMSDWSG